MTDKARRTRTSAILQVILSLSGKGLNSRRFLPMALVLIVLYSVLLFVSATNLFLMLRPRKGAEKQTSITALIPARDEEETLVKLLPQLLKEVDRVFVYDDGSTDRTAEIAKELGATVITGGELPKGWCGKNHACHNLALVASEDSPSQWWVFLDADTQVKPGFGAALSDLALSAGRRAPVITGFGKFIPGKGLEPAYLFWVPWILLATIPFGLIYRTGMAHPRFTNGQFVMWDASRYMEMQPHKHLRDAMLEDVRIGRWLAKARVRVEVALLPQVFGVQMYAGLTDAIRGMAKNSWEIAGSLSGSILLAMALAFIGAGSFFEPFTLPLLALSALVVAITLRSFPWAWLFLPLSLCAAALTILQSTLNPNTSRVWKGRTYQSEEPEG